MHSQAGYFNVHFALVLFCFWVSLQDQQLLGCRTNCGIARDESN